MMVPARGGVKDWQVYDVTFYEDSDYEIDEDLLLRWRDIQEKFQDIQEELEEALVAKKEK
jgi:hypothetical protein